MSSDGLIRGLIFDVGGVLIVQDPKEYALLDREYGLRDNTLWFALYRIPEWNEIQTGRGSAEAYDAAVLAYLAREGCSDPAGMVERIRTQATRLHEQVIDLIRSLRDTYRIGLLSNATARLEEMLAELGLHEGLVHDVVNSARVGLAKPDPAVYRLAAERLGLAPGQCFFVDDYDKNVIAAREVGMHAHHFRGYEGLAAELRSLGVLT
jgi:putative hydrolase of the HAD superfamily